MVDIIDLGAIVCGWVLCGAVNYALETWLTGRFTNDEEEYGVLMMLLGPIGLLDLVLDCVGFAFLFILGKAIEKCVFHWRRLVVYLCR